MSAGEIPYEVTVEVLKSRHDCHDKGTIFKYPDDLSKMCTWVRLLVSQIAEIFRHGGNFPCLARKEGNSDEIDIVCPDDGKVKFRIKRICLDKPIMDPFE